jgi:tRNA A37 methylthiotransferase MiaB
MLSESDIKEIILIAQDTTNYGKDIYGILALDKLLVKLSK